MKWRQNMAATLTVMSCVNVLYLSDDIRYRELYRFKWHLSTGSTVTMSWVIYPKAFPYTNASSIISFKCWSRMILLIWFSLLFCRLVYQTRVNCGCLPVWTLIPSLVLLLGIPNRMLLSNPQMLQRFTYFQYFCVKFLTRKILTDQPPFCPEPCAPLFSTISSNKYY